MSFRCQSCNRPFDGQRSLEQHLASPAHASYKCSKCGRSFAGPKALDQHLNSPAHAPVGLASPAPALVHVCKECDRSFGSQQALDQHLRSPAHAPAYECKECDRSFGSQQALNEHLDSPAHVLAHPVKKGARKIRKRKKAQQVRRQDDNTDAFFAEYSSFPYNRNSLPQDEMIRMCRFFGWPKRGQRECPARDEAWERFRIALVLDFNSMFGHDANDTNAWESICRLLGIAPIPETMEDRRQAVAETHVNLMDMFSETRAGRKVRIFPTKEELSRYTIENFKYFPKEEAYEGGLLKYLLREIFNKYQGTRAQIEDGPNLQSVDNSAENPTSMDYFLASVLIMNVSKLLKHFKRPKVRGSAESALVASAAVPDSGFTFVKNSQGASAAIAELSKSLDTALDEIELDGMHTRERMEHLN
ncbi:hypothetical protein GP486_004958 [Trichoglossum hirsutum]|uniref:C2H2-type domain-containing protein n=1 Tax=Trichoglossum hirsutum TaxID=265104 RepID=A0A9P8LAD5_9PEZI|nr:hypothetical protein GP486_004958 [Trichoglossum hirsutum]